MEFNYDLHIHSCLSPCGDMDMTPNNIINMAKLLNLDIIALTDHNTCLNCEALISLSNKHDITVVPGMELTTSEEIHVVCLFPALEDALRFNDYVKEHQFSIKNKEKIYGRQVIMNEKDEETGEIENLLIIATDISVMDVKKLVDDYNGIAFPAHIDKSSTSVLSVLGEIPNECEFTCAEIYPHDKTEELIAKYPILGNMHHIYSSDAHYLENMTESIKKINLKDRSAKSLIDYLKAEKSV